MSTITSEKFFYIMDYSSHYYRVDAKDQLVAAGSEDEATIFTFADANRRIGAGLKSRFYFMTPVASDEDTEGEPVAEEEEKQGSLAETIISTVKEVTETKTATPIAAPSEEYDLSAINWEDYLTNFSYIASNINCYKDELTQKLSEVDKKICDILHYIELCDTDEDDAQNLVDLLRACREERRYLKDEIFKAEMFQKNVGTNANIAKVRDAIKSIKGLANRKYTPRELSDLFAGEVISVKPREKKQQVVQTQETEPYTEPTEYYEEAGQMEYVKRETPFDGKENDWLEFARKQAEFYQNANQYITNLEIELDEIDGEIAALMDKIEVANCNVTQGYKLFKQLKDLRQARTKKETELKVLYNLTGNFDMGAMAEESMRSAEDIDEILNGPMHDPEEAETEETDPDEDEKVINMAG